MGELGTFTAPQLQHVLQRLENLRADDPWEVTSFPRIGPRDPRELLLSQAVRPHRTWPSVHRA